MIVYKINSSQKHLQKIADVMSSKSMKEIDKNIIGDIFTHTKLEQDMPKLTEKKELLNYSSPTLVLTGANDIFFPSDKIIKTAEEIIVNLESNVYEMGHFPSEEFLKKINNDIQRFLAIHY